MNTDYLNSHEYESLIRLAFNCDREEYDAHHANMLNLIWKENESSAVAHLRIEDLLRTVKGAMDKAFYEIYKLPLSEDDRLTLAAAHARIGEYDNSGLLLEICMTGRDMILKYR